jgi:hypothetical protein
MNKFNFLERRGVGRGGIFEHQGGGVQTKNFWEENRHFESWRGKKIGPLARIYTPEK